MRVLAGILSALILAGCTGDGGTPSANRQGIAYPGAELLREVPSTTAEIYDSPEGTNSCSTSLKSYGVHDEPEAVTEFFEQRGFLRRGEGGQFPQGYRWVGVRDGDQMRWRKVDIADGEIAGRTEWRTVFEVFTPACETEPESGMTPAATRSS